MRIAGKLLSLSRYLATFGLARGTLFFAPLVLASLLPTADYGALEWAYATATVVATLAAVGTVSVVPLVLTGASPPGTSIDGLRLHQILVAAFFGVSAAAAAMAGLLQTSQAALLAAVISLQSFQSTQLRANNRADASLLTDAALMGCMMLAGIAMHALRPDLVTIAAWGAAAACLLCLLLPLLLELRRAGLGPASVAWGPSLRVGVPLLFTGLLATLLTSLGRLAMGSLSDPETTGLYSVLARGAALPVIAHQLITVGRFRRIFVEERRDLERTLLTILAAVAASALGFWCFCPWLSFALGPAFARAAAAHRADLLWLLSQSVLWSGIALNDFLSARFHTASKVLRLTLPVFLILVLSGVLVLHWVGVSLSSFVRIHGAIMVVFYATQALVMRAAGIQMTRVWAFTVVIYLALAFLASLA